MRYQGRVKTWKDDKAFGFIAPNGGGPDVFMHISSLRGRSTKPSVGRLVTYGLSSDDRGRPRAIDVQLLDEPHQTRRAGSPWATAVMLLLAGVFGYGAYRFSQSGNAVPTSPADSAEFSCSPQKNSCSTMTSCAEARFHMQRCGVAGMDGDNDGIPCEQQWCN
jgi:cold shock CspA family protein